MNDIAAQRQKNLDALTAATPEIVQTFASIFAPPAEPMTPAEAAASEIEALRDMLHDARLELDLLREALDVPYEPHQSLRDRMLQAADNRVEIESRLRRMEDVQATVIRDFEITNALQRAEIEFLRKPRPLWHRILNVGFPIHNGAQ